MQGDCSEILVRGQLLDIQGGGARKSFEINKFLVKSGEINKFLLTSGEKNICTQARHRIFLAPPPWISNGLPLSNSSKQQARDACIMQCMDHWMLL